MLTKSLKNKLGLHSRPTRTPPNEGQKGARFPAPPGTFEPPERRLWRKIVRHYTLDEPAALALLRSTLEAHARMRRCGESITKVGELVVTRRKVGRTKGDKGDEKSAPAPETVIIKAHPLISAERDSRAAWLSGLRALGILEIPEE
jgi:hypothetical protein